MWGKSLQPGLSPKRPPRGGRDFKRNKAVEKGGIAWPGPGHLQPELLQRSQHQSGKVRLERRLVSPSHVTQLTSS